MLITGGGRGIGAATARLAAEAGYAVAINYLSDHAPAERLAEEIRRTEKTGHKRSPGITRGVGVELNWRMLLRWCWCDAKPQRAELLEWGNSLGEFW